MNTYKIFLYWIKCMCAEINISFLYFLSLTLCKDMQEWNKNVFQMFATRTTIFYSTSTHYHIFFNLILIFFFFTYHMKVLMKIDVFQCKCLSEHLEDDCTSSTVFEGVILRMWIFIVFFILFFFTSKYARCIWDFILTSFVKR